MTFKNVARITVVLAVALLAVPAFAQGTATYLGTHTASDVQIDGLGIFADATVIYAGGTITITSSTLGFSGPRLPDNLNMDMHLTGDGTYTVVIDSINVGTTMDTDHLGFYLDETTIDTSQVWMGFTTDGGGGVTATLSVGPTGSMDAGDPANVARGPIMLPATVVLTRTGADVVVTIDAVPFGTATMLDAAVDHIPRFFDEGPGDGSISVSSIVVTGVGIPDVNAPTGPTGPTVTITRDGAIDSAFITGNGTWSVEFSEDVQFVTDDDFEITTGGDGAFTSGPTVTANGPASYTVAVGGVTASPGPGSIALNFLGGDVASIDTDLLASAAGGQSYTNFPLPAAKTWGLVFLGAVLALAAAVLVRKKALKH